LSASTVTILLIGDDIDYLWKYCKCSKEEKEDKSEADLLRLAGPAKRGNSAVGGGWSMHCRVHFRMHIVPRDSVVVALSSYLLNALRPNNPLFVAIESIMGCGPSKGNALNNVDDSVHVMLKHDRKMQKKHGEKPHGYVPRAQHPLMQQDSSVKGAEDSSKKGAEGSSNTGATAVEPDDVNVTPHNPNEAATSTAVMPQ
jgi:hypothetical protein